MAIARPVMDQQTIAITTVPQGNGSGTALIDLHGNLPRLFERLSRPGGAYRQEAEDCQGQPECVFFCRIVAFRGAKADKRRRQPKSSCERKPAGTTMHGEAWKRMGSCRPR